MKTEKELNNDLTENSEETKIKHFIYLDRERLNSYASQLSDGIVQVRRLGENEVTKITKGSNDEYTEEIQEDGREGEISIGPKNYAGGLSGKTIDKTTRKQGFRKGLTTEGSEFSYSAFEDIHTHDNGYLEFEEDLIKKGFLKEIKDESELKEYSSLIKITGTSKFFDWDSIVETFSDKEILYMLMDQGNNSLTSNQKKTKEKEMNIALKVIKTFSLGSLTIHTQLGISNAIGSINPKNLCMTKDQLRTAYILPGDVDVTVVGFIPRRKVGKINFPGIAGSIDFAELWKAFVGEVDIAIDPIAIYTEISF